MKGLPKRRLRETANIVHWFVWCVGPIDNGWGEHQGLVMPISLADIPSAIRFAARGIGWEGDAYVDNVVAFAVPDPDNNCFRIGMVWKQHNNGSTFIASPCFQDVDVDELVTTLFAPEVELVSFDEEAMPDR